jgi:hypothetical protein
MLIGARETEHQTDTTEMSVNAPHDKINRRQAGDYLRQCILGDFAKVDGKKFLHCCAISDDALQIGSKRNG